MVQKGSPREKAHGALTLFRSTENQRAFAGDAPRRHSQPPSRTHCPSALASALKAMPRFAATGLICETRPSPRTVPGAAMQPPPEGAAG